MDLGPDGLDGDGEATDWVSELHWEHEPELDAPIMIVAFEGLFDAAGAATAAVSRLVDETGAGRFAQIDPDKFFDFTQRRPTIALDADLRSVVWPQNAFLAARSDDSHDLVLTAGVEPHLRWPTFADDVVTVARRCDAVMVVTLGATVGVAPHTRPLGVVASSSDPGLADRLGLATPSYEGPTGLVGVLHERLEATAIPAVSLRVAVPHYVPAPPNPEATRSLLSRLELVLGVGSSRADLDEAAVEWRRQVDAAVREDPEIAEYVAELERTVDSTDELVPSAEELADELEAWLRERGS